MARLPRYTVPGHPQHLIQRGNNRSLLFAADADYRFFHDCLTVACQRFGCQVHAYVLMANHVHLLLTPEKEVSISKMMQSVGRRYVQHFNASSGRTGTLWEGRYKATLVDAEHYLLTCYRYVELNPVRAGLVMHPGQYRWSSYAANALGQRDPLVATHARYRELGAGPGARQAAYRSLFKISIDESTLCDIREATNKGWALGFDQLPEEMANRLNRRMRPLPRGGDRRSRAYRERRTPDSEPTVCRPDAALPEEEEEFSDR